MKIADGYNRNALMLQLEGVKIDPCSMLLAPVTTAVKLIFWVSIILF